LRTRGLLFLATESPQVELAAHAETGQRPDRDDAPQLSARGARGLRGGMVCSGVRLAAEFVAAVVKKQGGGPA
jgi:hypothetical protein